MIPKMLAVISITAKLVVTSSLKQVSEIVSFFNGVLVSIGGYLKNKVTMLVKFIKEQTYKVALRLWNLYSSFECQIAYLLIDIGLAVYVSRYLLSIIVGGIVLAYFRHWLLFIIYIIFIIISVIRYFRIDDEEIENEQKNFDSIRDNLAKYSRYVFRVLLSLGITYVTYMYFTVDKLSVVDNKSIHNNPVNINLVAKEIKSIQKMPKNKKEDESCPKEKKLFDEKTPVSCLFEEKK